jgi:hypothetical protein
MKISLSVAVAIMAAIGTTRIVGCESTNEQQSQGSIEGFAGGNGAFGESPMQPGAYPDDSTRNSSRQQPAQSSSDSR